MKFENEETNVLFDLEYFNFSRIRSLHPCDGIKADHKKYDSLINILFSY